MVSKKLAARFLYFTPLAENGPFYTLTDCWTLVNLVSDNRAELSLSLSTCVPQHSYGQ